MALEFFINVSLYLFNISIDFFDREIGVALHLFDFAHSLVSYRASILTHPIFTLREESSQILISLNACANFVNCRRSLSINSQSLFLSSSSISLVNQTKKLFGIDRAYSLATCLDFIDNRLKRCGDILIRLKTRAIVFNLCIVKTHPVSNSRILSKTHLDSIVCDIDAWRINLSICCCQRQLCIIEVYILLLINSILKIQCINKSCQRTLINAIRQILYFLIHLSCISVRIPVLIELAIESLIRVRSRIVCNVISSTIVLSLCCRSPSCYWTTIKVRVYNVGSHIYRTLWIYQFCNLIIQRLNSITDILYCSSAIVENFLLGS